MRNAMKNDVFTQTTDQPAPVGIATTKSKKPNNSKQKEILVCLWRGRSVYARVIAKFSGMGSLPHFLTHGAPLRARELR